MINEERLLELFPGYPIGGWVNCFGGWRHMTSLVFPTSHIGQDVIIGPATLIEDRSRINSNSIIYGCTLIGKNVHVGFNCKVGNSCCIEESCRIGDFSVIKERCFIEDSSRVGRNCVIGQSCILRTKCLIGHKVKLSKKVIISQRMKIQEESYFRITPIFCQLSPWSIYHSGKDKITIGCETNTIQNWEVDWKNILYKHTNYGEITTRNINEYKRVFFLIKSSNYHLFHKNKKNL